jgi:hypothetical protein
MEPSGSGSNFTEFVVAAQATDITYTLPVSQATDRVLRNTDGAGTLAWGQVVLTTDVTGTLPVASGGTNSSVALNNNRIMVSSGGAIVEAAALTNGQIFIGSTGAAPVAASLTAGTGITITPGAGTITIANSGAGTTDHTALSNLSWTASAHTGTANRFAHFDGSGVADLVAFGSAAGTVCEGNDARLSDARTPTVHAASHQHGGSDEVAVAASAANAIPKALGTGKLASGWITEVIALVDLTDVAAKTGSGTTVVMDTSPTIVTPTIASFTNAQHNHQNAAGGGTLDAGAIASGTLVVARGGTNSSVALNNNRIMVSSGGSIVEAAALTNGQLLIGSTGVAPVAASLTAGTGISITPGVGAITIAATGVGTDHASLSNLSWTASGHTGTASTFAHFNGSGVADLVSFGSGAGTVCQGNDARLSDARTPTAHAASHQHGGSDEVATATAAANAIPKALGTGKLAAGWIQEVIGLVDLTDVTSKTGTGTIVVMDTSAVLTTPTLTTPTIGDFTNATHTHQNAAGGGQLDHNAALTNLTVGDPHTQYVFLAGRAGGQVVTGGTAASNSLTLRSTSNATKGNINLADQGGDIIIGGGTTASRLRLLEPSGSGTNFTEFVVAAQAGDITYTLPTSVAANRFMKTDGAGVLSWNQISLTADVTGVLPVANGGTNSSTALFGDRLMISNAVSIFEADALLDGQLMIGETGSQPIAANITAGSGISIVNGGGSITISATGGGGSVTSVGLSLPGIFTVSGSPVTTTGTLTGSLATQTANTIWAGPTSGGAAAPTFRAIVAADISEKIALADLTDVTAKSGTGTTVVMTGSPTITTPAIADFTNATHTHQSTATGGQLDHGLALTGLTDDDHTQYALLAGRAGGQTLTGGTAASENLTLRSTTNATKGDIKLADQGGNVVIGGGTTASRLRLMEPSGSGTNYVELFVSALPGNTTYTWPNDYGPGAGCVLWDENADGNLAWAKFSVTAPLTLGYNNGTRTLTLATSVVGVVQGRLTLTTATPVISTGVTAATVVYFTPWNGNSISLVTSAVWATRTFTEQSIKITDTQTGSTHSGNGIIDGLTDTSKLVRGMKVSGTNVGVGAVINSINSATQVTVSVNSTGSASNPITFKCPAGKNYDIFAVDVSSALALRFGNAWTNDTTRADAIGQQDGVDVNNAVINSGDSNSIAAKCGVHLGTVRITGTDGETEFSISKDSTGGSSVKCFVSNRYNQSYFELLAYDSTNSWAYTTATNRPSNNSNNNRVEILNSCIDKDLLAMNVGLYSVTIGFPLTGIGVGSTTVMSGKINAYAQAGAGATVNTSYYFNKQPVGYQYYQALENGNGATGSEFYGDLGFPTVSQSGIKVGVWA